MFPRSHVFWHNSLKLVWSLLLKFVFISEFEFLFVVFLIILLVPLENFWVMSHVLLVRRKFLLPFFVGGLWVADMSKINRSNVVMVNSVFDVIKVIMCRWHAYFSKFIHKLVVQTLTLVFDYFVTTVDLLSESQFSFFRINLGKLLHLQLMLCH